MLRILPCACAFVLLAIPTQGCDSDPEATGGSGGATGGTGGGGGMGGGVGGTAGDPGQRCTVPSNCNDGDPCTTETCIDGLCGWDPLPNDTRCLSIAGPSACLDGVCPPIWSSCLDDGAEDGDFCTIDPEPEPPRLGRCNAGACEPQGDCTNDFECWDGAACSAGECNMGDCSLGNAPDGIPCVPPLGGQCAEGVCMSLPG